MPSEYLIFLELSSKKKKKEKKKQKLKQTRKTIIETAAYLNPEKWLGSYKSIICQNQGLSVQLRNGDLDFCTTGSEFLNQME